jgi:hypothetical protein
MTATTAWPTSIADLAATYVQGQQAGERALRLAAAGAAPPDALLHLLAAQAVLDGVPLAGSARARGFMRAVQKRIESDPK